MFDPVRDVEEFHEKFGLLYDGKPRVLSGELGDFRAKFLAEELSEYTDSQMVARILILEPKPDCAELTHHLELQLDALVDLVYVALGNAHLQGFDFREAWRRVHAANMAKVRATKPSDSKRGTTFDVVKPPGWEAPNHKDLVEDHAYTGA